jgi:hypothetical protein
MTDVPAARDATTTNVGYCRGASLYGMTGTDQYRHDARGRRILAREPHDSAPCPSSPTPPGCLGAIAHFMWDGAQMLYETRYPGDSSLATADPERDTAKVNSLDGRWGRVAHLNGPGVGHPLGTKRLHRPSRSEGPSGRESRAAAAR